MRLQRRLFLAFLFFTSLGWSSITFAAGQPPKTIVDNGDSKSFVFVPEVKLTSVNNQFGNLIGARFGLMLNHKFMIGLGGYGMPIPENVPMGYGGVAVEYLPWSDRATHFSFGALVGAGGLPNLTFLVVEPHVKFNANISAWLRLGVGGGYRFIGGAGSADSLLRGPELTLSLGFGR